MLVRHAIYLKLSQTNSQIFCVLYNELTMCLFVETVSSNTFRGRKCHSVTAQRVLLCHYLIFFEGLEHQAYQHPTTLQYYYFPIFFHRYISHLLQHLHTSIHSWDLLLPNEQQNVCVCNYSKTNRHQQAFGW